MIKTIDNIFNVKNWVKNIPYLRSIAKFIYLTLLEPLKPFYGSEIYWKNRYYSGGSSGPGSYNHLSKFKADVLNSFVIKNKIETIIEYGCGDGNQLRTSRYPSYIGFDVSDVAIKKCKNIFINDSTKKFKLMIDYKAETAQLTLSLDVIYHLVEYDVFITYMNRLFDSSKQFVVIYSSNTSRQRKFQDSHIKHRNFSKWIDQNKPDWELMRYIPNKYPYTGDEQRGSFSDFFIYKKVDI